ncbi:Holliday junction resolvase RuvX [Sporolactobacillus laevolacticus]|jgi:putative Holliday junction resolvase|uniref:Putative pre-16S rRNA nuclease n=1 Tax=Sporolactobacillus laevolacticus DSM 442 TaxID=1395513 RepID=V6J9E8_9BACL|nr:Holliday junction resolvase RuvX [Sporolactobacillus laevolacticus]EST13409.1 Holliday junction resolvase [Sporolactobacillus laevolacticus DSM 442]MDN3955467.1 Holliday junction resolvase RuvX [Sporolactobacillus laevolacticus]
MRIMGLDFGTVTVGVAISDPLGWTAQGIETVHYVEHKKNLLFDRIGELIQEYGVESVVVGLPRDLIGTESERALASRSFAKSVRRKFKIPVELWDERLTTMAAERILIAADVSRKKRKQVIDKEAAVLILQSYLDKKRMESKNDE